MPTMAQEHPLLTLLLLLQEQPQHQAIPMPHPAMGQLVASLRLQESTIPIGPVGPVAMIMTLPGLDIATMEGLEVIRPAMIARQETVMEVVIMDETLDAAATVIAMNDLDHPMVEIATDHPRTEEAVVVVVVEEEDMEVCFENIGSALSFDMASTA